MKNNKIELWVHLGISLLGMFVVTWVCSNLLDSVYDKNRVLTEEVYRLEERIESSQPVIIEVIATMYHPVKQQTDNDPHITADGTRISIYSASKYRFIAVSRNLLKDNGGYLEYGDYVIIEGTNGKYNGVWQVKDTMNERFYDRIDFLCSPGTKQFKFDGASLQII